MTDGYTVKDAVNMRWNVNFSAHDIPFQRLLSRQLKMDSPNLWMIRSAGQRRVEPPTGKQAGKAYSRCPSGFSHRHAGGN